MSACVDAPVMLLKYSRFTASQILTGLDTAKVVATPVKPSDLAVPSLLKDATKASCICVQSSARITVEGLNTL